ncbi:hypothetical protein RND71_035678 [Anisodus tanguticus]|uniref:Uncharacterized protein n=1 Tax=Anisodus tanguticus TaxID=243964 RepID=A0AAE1UW21_9SOLA|nr:hypothetical protein RND71_035678 [Anisodus tanguticus]
MDRVFFRSREVGSNDHSKIQNLNMLLTSNLILQVYNMESPWLENSSLVDLKRLIKELNYGQELTYQLREVIKKHLGNNRGTTNTMLVEDLVGKIMTCFCKTLSILCSGKLDEASQVPVVAVSPCRMYSENHSTGSCKTTSLKDQKKCNKKR